MHQALEALCAQLEVLGQQINNVFPENRTFQEIFGWTLPAVTKHDLIGLATGLAKRIREKNAEDISEEINAKVSSCIANTQNMLASVVPQISNGNAGHAVPSIIHTLNLWDNSLKPIQSPSFKDLPVLIDSKLDPNALAKRLKSTRGLLDLLEPKIHELQTKIKLIDDASDAAEIIPSQLSAFEDARKELDRLTNAMENARNEANQKNQDAQKIFITLKSKKEEAEKIIENCQEAYRATTTQGLAAAFSERAINLQASTRYWIVGLLMALVGGVTIGAHRIDVISAMLNAETPQWGRIWMNVILSALSLGAPLWFAWLATKQIGQRFRLAEDYAFKASVAKAYEGYRREAARIDEVFEARLFASALTRLEEAPLRLIDTEAHGSPWHEFINSSAFKTAIDSIPELRDKFVEVAKSGIEAIKKPSQQ